MISPNEEAQAKLMLEAGMVPERVSQVIRDQRSRASGPQLGDFGHRIQEIMTHLSQGRSPLKIPKAAMKKFEGIELFPRYKRGSAPEPAASRISKAMVHLKPFVENWLSGSDPSWPGFVFHGMAGTCKTAVAMELGWIFYDAGRHASIDIAITVLNSFKDMVNAEHPPMGDIEMTTRYLKPDYAIFDDIGIQTRSNYEMTKFYQMLTQRYNLVKPSVLTTNLDLNTADGQHEFENCVSPQVADRLKAYFVDAGQWGDGSVR